MDEFPSLAGQVLIAMPSIGDSRFERTVIYMCVHDANGAMGLVINRPDARQTVGGVLVELGLMDEAEVLSANRQSGRGAAARRERLAAQVLLGGPVEATRGFVLHTPDFPERQGTVAVNEDVHLSTRVDVLRDIGRGAGPDQFLFALGFASWAAGQLDQEILQNAWLHAAIAPRALFSTPPGLHYAASLSSLGVDVHQLSPVAGRG